MANLTIRDIPDDVLEKLRIIAKTDRRSLNGEMLHVIEAGLGYLVGQRDHVGSVPLSKETQLAIWEELAGQWQDEEPFEATVSGIYAQRTEGRKVAL